MADKVEKYNGGLDIQAPEGVKVNGVLVLTENGISIYESPYYTTSGTSDSNTLAHGLGAIPDLIQVNIKCKTAEFGYSVGDILMVNNGVNAALDTSDGHSLVIDSTNLNMRWYSGRYQILNKTTGLLQTSTQANWEVQVKAWVFA